MVATTRSESWSKPVIAVWDPSCGATETPDAVGAGGWWGASGVQPFRRAFGLRLALQRVGRRVPDLHQ
ncbi:hypothetical protein GCM10009610_63430 [Pseudonocardia xinjiangensis]